MVEVWKDIKDYEGLYQVSNLGRVKSLDRFVVNRLLKGNIKITKTDFYGYIPVSFTKNGKRKTFKVHRLVAKTFIDNNDNKPCVNHINGVKHDNVLSNLEWVTYKENFSHALNMGLRKKINYERSIIMLDLNGNKLLIFDNVKEGAIAINGNSPCIHQVLSGKRKQMYGYKWDYASKYINKETEEEK